jgi:hypothetical protein
VEHTLLHTVESEAAGTLTISNLTFEHANIGGASGGALEIDAHGLTLSGDSFLENTVSDGEGAAASLIVNAEPCAASAEPALRIVGSTFRQNRSASKSSNVFGGAVAAFLGCPLVPSVLEHDAFEANTLEAGGSNPSAGGGLFVAGGVFEATVPLLQADDVFDSNRVLVDGTPGSYGGGGEWVQGIDLTSVGDRFSRNSLPGTSGANWSWGAGLGILNDDCNEKTPTESTLENAVVTDNSIGSGEAKNLGGAGIYIGCDVSPTASNHLHLYDSTVTENTTPSGGVAGIDGGPEDQLTVQNSIVANDVGGSETGGFTGPGGSITASYSDLCASGASSPAPGTGNICAAPLLADAGDPESLDVHEMRSSPTVQAGSTELVPSGLTSGFYGEPRIDPAHSIEGCDGPMPVGAEVDMGASELPAADIIPPVPACAPFGLQTKPVLQQSVFTLPSLQVRASGLLGLSFADLAAGNVSVLGTFELHKTVTVRVKGHRTHRHKTETVVYGRADYTVPAPGALKLALTPTTRALTLLRRHGRLRVTLSITFTASGELPTTHTETITVSYVKPRHKHRG